jgi:RNA polymerase sigma factor (sigma-70 family)
VDAVHRGTAQGAETPRQPFAQEEVVGAEHPNDFLAKQRPYLALLARIWLPGWLRQWLDYSGVVHETLANAYGRRDQLAAMAPAQLARHLETTLRNVVRDALLEHWRERPTGFPLEDVSTSVSVLWPALEDGQSPSEHASREEQLVELADALDQMSERERTAIEMRYLRRPACSLEKIGQELHCTERVAGSLLCGALSKFRRLLRKSQL